MWGKKKEILVEPLMSINCWLYFLNSTSLQSIAPVNTGAWEGITKLSSGCIKSIGLVGTGTSFCCFSILQMDSWLTCYVYAFLLYNLLFFFFSPTPNFC